MSEWSQINLYDQKPAEGAKPVIRICDRWGVPEEVIPTLQAVFNLGHKTPQGIAFAIVTMTETMSWSNEQRWVITEDMEEGSTRFSYTVDLTTTPWIVKVTKEAGYALIDNGDGTASIGQLVPARSTTVLLGEFDLAAIETALALKRAEKFEVVTVRSNS